MKTLLIDHNDSFTQNLKHWLQSFSNTVTVVNTDEIDLAEMKKTILTFDFLVISPGPKRPEDYPNTISILNTWPLDRLALGVCLGAQIMAISSGGTVCSYENPKHGKTSIIKFLNQKLVVARYHSLKIVSDNFYKPLAWSEDDAVPMLFSHTQKSWIGFQFHPESFLTENSEFWAQYILSKKTMNLV